MHLLQPQALNRTAFFHTTAGTMENDYTVHPGQSVICRRGAKPRNMLVSWAAVQGYVGSFMKPPNPEPHERSQEGPSTQPPLMQTEPVHHLSFEPKP